MKYTIFFFLFVSTFLFSCKNENQYTPETYVSSLEERDSITNFFLPYFIPRPDKATLQARFSDSLKSFYLGQKKNDELKLHSYYIDPIDSTNYCMFIRRDRKSLYIDYRALGASFKRNGQTIADVELKFLTQMMRKDTIDREAPKLFKELIETKTIDASISNREVVFWPSEDVYYDKKERKWELKSGSEWGKLLQSAKDTL